MLQYVVITPARNEEEHLTRLLEAMVAQTHRPLRWVIVSDGSTDATDATVARYAQTYNWIQHVRRGERRERSFAAKVECFNDGLRAIQDLAYDVIGNLDADISFGPDYFAYLISRFESFPKLGVAGTPFVESGQAYDYRFTNIEHVSGACQMFRSECFAELGGYVPLKGGGIDWVAVTTARMKGWQTRTFTERTCTHHRAIGTGSAGRLRAAFRQGRKDYYLGGHPVWQAFRSVYQMRRPPIIIGGACLLAGYAWSAIRRQPRPISHDLIRFHRREQLARLQQLFRPFGKNAR